MSEIKENFRVRQAEIFPLSRHSETINIQSEIRPTIDKFSTK